MERDVIMFELGHHQFDEFLESTMKYSCFTESTSILNMVSGGAIEAVGRVQNLETAIKWALENKKEMDEKDKKFCTARLLLKKNKGFWNDPSKFPDNLKAQISYSSANRIVNALAKLVQKYLENSKCCFLGSFEIVSFGDMKKYTHAAIHGSEKEEMTTTAEEDVG